MGAAPGWARSGVRFGFPTKDVVWGLGKTSSRPRWLAWGAAWGLGGVSFALQVRGGPAGAAAAPVAQAARELWADGRAGLPETGLGQVGRRLPESQARPGRRQVIRERARPPTAKARVPETGLGQVGRRLPESQAEPARRPPAKPGRGYPPPCSPQAPGPRSPGSGRRRTRDRPRPRPRPSASQATRKPSGPRRTTNKSHQLLQLATRGQQ